ncbi:MAG: DNA topoisomerase IB, partial [Lacunisphaera sp.]
MKKRDLPDAPLLEAKNAAKDAGLRYISDKTPGWRRVASGRNFRFIDQRGKAIRNKKEIARVQRLAIPPAWTDVWICPSDKGHIQATGRDARGRKQYRYHPDWRLTRDGTKFERMIAFRRVLPKIRRRSAKDLRAKGLGRAKVIAAMVRLLDTAYIRVGNEEYAKQNHSFGLTTLRDRHVHIRGGTMQFKFIGKSGQMHDIELHDARVAKIV